MEGSGSAPATPDARVLLESRIWGDWTGIDCGCCYGLEWGGEYPRECRTCGGSGGLWLSPSGTRLAQYPGGPFAGVADQGDRDQAVKLRAALAALPKDETKPASVLVGETE